MKRTIQRFKDFKLQAHVFVLLATFLVAGSFLASQKLSGVIDPISLTLFRFIFASLILSPLIFFKQKYRSKIISTLPRAMIISLFYALFFIGMFKALETTTVLNTGTLYTLLPLITAILSLLILKQPIKIYQLFIYLVGIIGTSIVIFKGDLALMLDFSLNSGDILFLFATLCMALYSISTKKVYKKDDELIVLVFTTLIGGSIWMFGALMALDIPLEWHKIQGDLFYYMFYLTAFATLLTVYLYQNATIAIEPKKVMAYTYLNPVAIAILLFIFENQMISIWVLIGIVISMLATILLLIKD